MYNSLVAGNLIIAPPSLTSTNFAKSVIMLLGRQPTLGFVLNKPSNILISSIFQDIPASMDDNIFWGGSENTNTVWILHTKDWRMYNTTDITDEWCVTSNIDMFSIIAKYTQPMYWRVFVGCTIWKTGQLELEIEQIEVDTTSQGWMIAPTQSAEFIMDCSYSDLWYHCINESTKFAIRNMFSEHNNP